MVMVKIGQDNDGDAGTEMKILYVIVEIILHGNPYAIHPAIFKMARHSVAPFLGRSKQ